MKQSCLKNEFFYNKLRLIDQIPIDFLKVVMHIDNSESRPQTTFPRLDRQSLNSMKYSAELFLRNLLRAAATSAEKSFPVMGKQYLIFEISSFVGIVEYAIPKKEPAARNGSASLS